MGLYIFLISINCLKELRFVLGYSSEMFLAIQHAISQGIIQEIAGKSFTSKVVMQRFPQTAFLEDPLLIALERFITMVIMLGFAYTFVNTVRVVTEEKELQLKVMTRRYRKRQAFVQKHLRVIQTSDQCAPDETARCQNLNVASNNKAGFQNSVTLVPFATCGEITTLAKPMSDSGHISIRKCLQSDPAPSYEEVFWLSSYCTSVR